MSVHFERSYKSHGLGDNSGLHIRLNSGEDVYVYSCGYMMTEQRKFQIN
ncbi:MAG: hypothetical protein R2728_00845 [Chitinophagales bacterium]